MHTAFWCPLILAAAFSWTRGLLRLRLPRLLALATCVRGMARASAVRLARVCLRTRRARHRCVAVKHLGTKRATQEEELPCAAAHGAGLAPEKEECRVARAHSVALGSRSLRWGVKRGRFSSAFAFMNIVHEHTHTLHLCAGDKIPELPNPAKFLEHLPAVRTRDLQPP